MTLKCTIELVYPSADEANVVLNSISPDNFPFIYADADGNKIVLTSSSETSMQMLHTLEDLLACVKIAEDTFSLTQK